MKKDLKSPYLERTQNDSFLSFKLQVVSEFENGEMGVIDLTRKYGIQSCTSISRWVEKYSTFEKSYKINVMKRNSPEQELFELRQKVKLLEHQKKTL